MPLGIIFWVLMLIWLIFGVWASGPDIRGGQVRAFGGTLLVYVVIFVLGWRVFGFIVQG